MNPASSDDSPSVWLSIPQEAFKLVAAMATKELSETVEVHDMTADDVHAVVQRCLEPLGLSLPD